MHNLSKNTCINIYNHKHACYVEIPFMKHPLPALDEKKLLITYRLEAGCLGPDGENHITQFCQFAQSKFKADEEYMIWNLVDRSDKSLPEIQYSVMGKNLTTVQTQKYLSLFGKNIDLLEEQLSEKIADIIYQYRS